MESSKVIENIEPITVDIATFFHNLAFTDVIGWIGFITTGIIVLAVSIRSVIDVLKATGVFPRSWVNFIYKNEDEKIKRTLQELGVLSKVNHYKALTLGLNSKFVGMSDDQCKEQISNLSKSFIENSPLIVGDSTKEKLNYYLNLRGAFTSGRAELMVELICSFLSNTASKEAIEYDCIISRKSGLDLLGYHVAHIFGLPFILYHDQRSILKDSKIKSFDYLPEEVQKPIIIDDSCMGGSSIASLAMDYKEETGVQIEHAFVLFIRKEASVEKLNKVGVNLHYLEFYDDEKLKKLEEK